MPEHYDQRTEKPPPPRSNRRQSTLSIALEALGGGFIIALIISALLLNGCASRPPDALAFPELQDEVTLPPVQPLELGGRIDSTIVLINPPVTAVCRDGWVSYSQHRSGTCSGHGGVRDRVNWPKR